MTSPYRAMYIPQRFSKEFWHPAGHQFAIHINGNLSEQNEELNLFVNAPLFSYNGKPFHKGNIEVTTQGKELCMDAHVCQGLSFEMAPEYALRAKLATMY